MRAVVQERYGPPAEVLQLRDVDPPEVGDDQVLVRVRAAGVSRAVWHLVTGRPAPARLASGLRTPRVPIPGRDVAGTVEAVGRDVQGVAVGDEVLGAGLGTFAELAAVPAAKLALRPAGIDAEQAATVAISGWTALAAVRDVGRVQPGQRVLVIGASGGVGTYAVQLARHTGAEVTGVCSTTKVDLVRGLGVEHVIDYTREEVPADGSYDVIVDNGGNRPLQTLRRALAPTGTLVLVGGETGGRITGGFERQVVRAPLLSLVTRQRLRPLLASEDGDDLRTLTDLIERGAIRPVVDRAFPLQEAAKALQHLADGHARGMAVVVP
jgi:NADPH:quinone reductase-like Zn-dependent oxidoreductase